MEQLSELPKLSLRKNSGHWFAALLITIAAFGAPSGIRHSVTAVATNRAVSAEMVAGHTFTDATPTSHPAIMVREVSMVQRERPVVRHQAARAISELVNNPSGHYNANYAADARTTNTIDWSCIRNAESHDNYRQVSGAYGILTSSWNGLGFAGTPGSASIAVQDRVALRIFAMNGYQFLGSWNDVCTMSYGLG